MILLITMELQMIHRENSVHRFFFFLLLFLLLITMAQFMIQRENVFCIHSFFSFQIVYMLLLSVNYSVTVLYVEMLKTALYYDAEGPYHLHIVVTEKTKTVWETLLSSWELQQGKSHCPESYCVHENCNKSSCTVMKIVVFI